MEKKGSHSRLLPFHKWGLFTALLLLVLILFFLFRTDKEMELIIYDQDTGEEYVRTSVNLDDEFTVQWEHSVEKTIWKETLKVNKDGVIVLVETRFRSFGAGVPSSKEGNVYFEDGYLVMTDLQEVKDYYQWIHSHNAKFTIF